MLKSTLHIGAVFSELHISGFGNIAWSTNPNIKAERSSGWATKYIQSTAPVLVRTLEAIYLFYIFCTVCQISCAVYPCCLCRNNQLEKSTKESSVSQMGMLQSSNPVYSFPCRHFLYQKLKEESTETFAFCSQTRDKTTAWCALSFGTNSIMVGEGWSNSSIW